MGAASSCDWKDWTLNDDLFGDASTAVPPERMPLTASSTSRTLGGGSSTSSGSRDICNNNNGRGNGGGSGSFSHHHHRGGGNGPNGGGGGGGGGGGLSSSNTRFPPFWGWRETKKKTIFSTTNLQMTQSFDNFSPIWSNLLLLSLSFCLSPSFLHVFPLSFTFSLSLSLSPSIPHFLSLSLPLSLTLSLFLSFFLSLARAITSLVSLIGIALNHLFHHHISNSWNFPMPFQCRLRQFSSASSWLLLLFLNLS